MEGDQLLVTEKGHAFLRLWTFQQVDRGLFDEGWQPVPVERSAAPVTRKAKQRAKETALV